MKSQVSDWQESLLYLHSSIGDVVRVLNHVTAKIALIVGVNGELVGTVTDGDVRRGLLKGLDLNSPVGEAMNAKPVVVFENCTIEQVQRLMSAEKVFQVPVVNSENKPIALYIWHEFQDSSHGESLMVILAGGRGTRLLPKTENVPKPMLQIGGKPILERIIERAVSIGVNQFVIAVHHLGDVIESHFGDGKWLGAEISYVKEEQPLGTAGCLRLLDPVPEKPFLVTNGDVLTEVNYRRLLDFHIQNQAIGTMAVQSFDWQNPYGVVKTEGIQITAYEEKPITSSLVNAGVYVLQREALELVNTSGAMDMPSLFAKMKSSGQRIIAFPIHESWVDVGTIENLNATSERFK